jgi:hypothetical protein
MLIGGLLLLMLFMLRRIVAEASLTEKRQLSS